MISDFTLILSINVETRNKLEEIYRCLRKKCEILSGGRLDHLEQLLY
jgi:hypothetical protein